MSKFSVGDLVLINDTIPSLSAARNYVGKIGKIIRFSEYNSRCPVIVEFEYSTSSVSNIEAFAEHELDLVFTI